LPLGAQICRETRQWQKAPDPVGCVALFVGLQIGDDELMPRFVLLHHECPPSFGKPSHRDLMLERDGVLLTWSLPILPAGWRLEGDSAADAGDESIVATRLADHRIEYLDYEGPISGGRGIVTRVDGGEYEVVAETDGVLRVRLQGMPCDDVIELRL
jgi:hypothetical protein